MARSLHRNYIYRTKTKTELHDLESCRIKRYYLSHSHYTRFLVFNVLSAKARNVTDKITPAILRTIISQEFFSQCVVVLGIKAHETSAS